MKDNAQDIVKMLLDGSKAIDRMREEVEDVIRIIVGLLREEMSYEFSVKFQSEESQWSILHWITGGKMIFEVQCFIPLSYGWKSGYSLRKEFPFHSDDVQQVHRCLPDFVQGVMKEFPKIEEKWQFLIDAATK